MSHRSSFLALLVLLGVPATSHAVDCAGLPAALTVSSTTVTLDQGAVCTGNYTVTGTGITLEGAGTGATFNTIAGGRALSGSSVGAITIRNLTFTSPDGARGGISLSTATSPTIDHVTFLHNGGVTAGGGLAASVSAGPIVVTDSVFGHPGDANSATTNGGGAYLSAASAGAIDVTRTTFQGNSTTAAGSTLGGGLFAMSDGPVTVRDSTFTGNFLGAAQSGAGGAAVISSGQGTVSGTSFSGNQVRAVDNFSTAQAGALVLQDSVDATTPNVLRGNTFNNNSVVAPPTPSTGGAVAAGAAAVIGPSLLEGNTWTANSLPLNAVGAATLGGALAIRAGVCSGAPVITLRNEFFRDNHIVDSGQGAAIYILGDCAQSFLVDNGTFRDNSVGSGSGAGIHVSGAATMTAANSILWNDTGAAEVSTDNGGIATIGSSDVCDAGVPFAGTANICSDPLFSSATAVAVDSASPVVDHGSNALVPSGLTTSITGGARILDGDGDGAATVDMGAAERAVPAPPVVAPPLTTPPVTTPPATPPPSSTPPITDPGQVLLCAGHRVVLIDVHRDGRFVVARGLSLASLAGTKVTVTADHGGGNGHARIARDGSFTVRLKRPRSAATSYTAIFGKDRSSPLKLTRNLDVISQKVTAAGLKIVAAHSKGRHVAGQTVTIRRQFGCGKQTVAGTLTFDKRGRVTTVLPKPSGADTIAVYRLTTKTNNTFTLPIVVRR